MLLLANHITAMANNNKGDTHIRDNWMWEIWWIFWGRKTPNGLWVKVKVWFSDFRMLRFSPEFFSHFLTTNYDKTILQNMTKKTKNYQLWPNMTILPIMTKYYNITKYDQVWPNMTPRIPAGFPKAAPSNYPLQWTT